MILSHFFPLFVFSVLFRPIGVHLKMRNRKISPPIYNVTLEENYRRSKKLSSKKIDELTKKLDMSQQEIGRWWRRRRAQDRPTVLNKFCESCWKCAFYAFNFTLSLIVLWDTPYFWNIFQCAYGYPHHVSI